MEQNNGLFAVHYANINTTADFDTQLSNKNYEKYQHFNGNQQLKQPQRTN